MTGIAMMPILPFIGDDVAHIDETIRAVMDHGGKFVIGGGLTMSGQQAERTLRAAIEYDPSLEEKVRKMYQWEIPGMPNYSPSVRYNSALGLRIREICTKYGLLDRMPRYIIPGELSINKRIAEILFLRTYDLELEMAPVHRIWSYRKAAWSVEELKQNIEAFYSEKGMSGLQALPGICKNLAVKIERWMREMEPNRNTSESEHA